MATQDEYKKAILKAHNKGDFEAAKVFAEKLKTLQAAETETSLADDIIGGAEVAASLVSGAVAEPISGIAGIAQSLNPFADEGAGADAVKATQEALTYQPRTDAGQQMQQSVGEALKPVGEAIQGAEKYLGDTAYDITGSPAVAAAATTLPTLAGEALGVAAGRGAIRSANKASDRAGENLRQAEDLAAGKATEETLSTGVDTLTKGSDEKIAEMMQLDPEFFTAMDELGISAEPLAAFASQNSQFRDISGALRSVPGSVLDVQAREFMEQASNAADDLILRYGGTLDKSELGERFKRESIANVDNLAAQADEAYTAIRDQLPLSTKVNPEETKAFLNEQVQSLGGVDNLPAELKGIYKSLNQDGGVTYGLLDLMRKDFGQATRSGQGRFKDASTGIAKAMYNRLSKDADATAEALGMGELTSVAKELIKKRKIVEDDLKALYGKDLNKSLGNIASGAVSGLAKGKVDEFINVFKRIPDGMKQEAAISFMNDAFKGTGSGQQALNATQFTKWYDTVNRSPRAKAALYSVLPKDSKKAIENLYKVSKGISRSQAQTVRTGAINSMFNPETGMLRRLVGNAAARVASTALTGNVAGLAMDSTREFLNQSTSGAKQASNMLSSPKFQKLMRDAVKDGYVQGRAISNNLEDAQRKFAKSEIYKKWANTLGQDQKAALAGGLIPYLFDESGVESNAVSDDTEK